MDVEFEGQKFVSSRDIDRERTELSEARQRVLNNEESLSSIETDNGNLQLLALATKQKAAFKTYYMYLSSKFNV